MDGCSWMFSWEISSQTWILSISQFLDSLTFPYFNFILNCRHPAIWGLSLSCIRGNPGPTGPSWSYIGSEDLIQVPNGIRVTLGKHMEGCASQQRNASPDHCQTIHAGCCRQQNVLLSISRLSCLSHVLSVNLSSVKSTGHPWRICQSCCSGKCQSVCILLGCKHRFNLETSGSHTTLMAYMYISDLLVLIL